MEWKNEYWLFVSGYGFGAMTIGIILLMDYFFKGKSKGLKMKQIKITCPKCKVETTYDRDNTSFYFKLIMIICISFAVGVLVKEYIAC